MKTKIVKMGNNTGICIPKIILEQCNMDTVVDVQICDGKLIINPISDEAKKNLLKAQDQKEQQLTETCWYEDESEWK